MEKQKEEGDEDGKGKSLYKADEYSNRNKYGTETANISLFFFTSKYLPSRKYLPIMST